jgi:hypothetical protein
MQQESTEINLQSLSYIGECNDLRETATQIFFRLPSVSVLYKLNENCMKYRENSICTLK